MHANIINEDELHQRAHVKPAQFRKLIFHLNKEILLLSTK